MRPREGAGTVPNPDLLTLVETVGGLCTLKLANEQREAGDGYSVFGILFCLFPTNELCREGSRGLLTPWALLAHTMEKGLEIQNL